MKVLISTLHFYNNYGSVLQAYALKKTLNNLGYEAEINNYQPHICDYSYFSDKKLCDLYENKKEKFDVFRKKELGIGNESGEYDAYIVGSDIIWGKEFSNLDPVYFLEGVPKNKPRIAYAASMICNGNHTENDELFSKYISNFSSIGMRETSSVDVIGQFVNDIPLTDVIDPTLLLAAKDYESLEIENDCMRGKPYLLSYFLTHDPAVVNYSNMIAKKLGLRIFHYFADYPDRIFPADSECFAFSGPGEFLGYIKNASCIFTNSFHGTCFSIIYRKPFYTYMAKRNMLSRVQDMAERLSVTDRYFTDFRDMDKISLKIDYSITEQQLEYQKDKSLEFLKKSLEI